MKLCLRVTFLIAMLFMATLPAVADVLYVDADAAGGSTGADWANAYTDLQDALDAVVSGDEIWVAAGTYYPTSDYGMGGGLQYYHFRMKNGVSILGGFSGDETSSEERDFDTSETILSGDIGVVNDMSDNCYHVFYHPVGTGLDETAVLEGFIITGGTVPDIYGSYGGGMYNTGSSPTIINCVFSQNSARTGGGICNSVSSPTIINCVFSQNGADSGGGICSINSSPTITNCTFRQNSARTGGGIDNDNSASTITNCTFSQNSAEDSGGGIDNDISSSTITNCTFSQNSAVFGGGICNLGLSPTITNCILWGDTADNHPEISNLGTFSNGMLLYNTPIISYCNIQGSGGSNSWDSALGMDDGNNIDADPLFVDPDNGDMHLTYNSPCIDVGNNNALPVGVTEDIDSDDRMIDGNGDDDVIVDMGADEFSSLPTANAGSDARVAGGEKVVLDGSASTDRDGIISEWLWEQIGGTDVSLSSSTSAKASFIAPNIASDKILTFRLTVTDDDGFEDIDTCEITVKATIVGADGGCFIDAISWYSTN